MDWKIWHGLVIFVIVVVVYVVPLIFSMEESNVNIHVFEMQVEYRHQCIVSKDIHILQSRSAPDLMSGFHFPINSLLGVIIFTSVWVLGRY